MSNISELKFDDKNFNKHTPSGMGLLEKSLQQFGAGRSILIDKDNNIIAGNGIVEAAGQVGLDKVKIIETTGDEIVAVKRTDISLNSEEGREMALADNATSAADLEWDKDNIAEFFEPGDLEEWDVDLDWDSDKEVEDDEAPEVDESEPAKSVLGGVYQLGEHRLMCGDSTDAGSVAILMDGQKADMVFTDPPYGMNLNTDYSGMKGFFGKSNKFDRVVGDNEDFKAELITTVLNNFSYCTELFLWGADYYAEIIPKRNAGSWLVWDKSIDDSGDKMFGSNFELCWSKSKHKREMVRIKWKGLFGMEKDDTKSRVHPTQKPAILAQWFLKRYSKEGDLIADIYGGSGSTLIACEQLGRKCYMMELDPKYCDVIRKRYWKFTHDGNEEGWQEGTPNINNKKGE